MSNFGMVAVNRNTKEEEKFMAIDKGDFYVYVREKDKKRFSEKEFCELYTER